MTNTTNNLIENKFIKVELFSDRNVNLGTEYIKIEKLDLAKTMDFEVKYSYTDVSNYKIDIVDEMPNPEEIQFIKFDEKTKLIVLAAGLLCIWAAPFIP